MARSCGVSYKAVGPYNQTLFLGCSIANFNISMGWGAESSTLSLNLVVDKSYHPSSPQYAPFDTALQQFNSTRPSRMPSHINLAKELESQEKNRFSTNKRLYSNPSNPDNTPNDVVDNGKVAWGTNINGPKTFWTDPDPGFLGLPNTFDNRGYDIIGVPVFFKFDDLYFGGVVNSWKNVGSQGGSLSYEVEIRSLASLLNGCHLIIDHYAGTIATLVAGTSVDNPTGEDVCVPSHYNIGNLPNYNGTIRQGTLPNVFNVYGFLEAGGFGNSGRTDRGIPAALIYDTIVTMLGPGTNDSHSPFCPYGAIIGRGISDRDGNIIDPTAVDISGPGRGRFTLNTIGVCRNRIAIDGVRRSMFKLDLTELPRPPSGLYMQGPNISLMQFITEICDGAGLDFFIDFQPVTDDYSGVIRVRTVSRRSQPDKEIIKNIVTGLLTDGVPIGTYNYGQEYNDQNTRVMYIGGKQKRLLQVKSTALSNKQNTLIFDPFANNGAGSFMNYDTLGQPGTNQYRDPNFVSTRRYLRGFRMSPGGGAVVAEGDNGFNNTTYFGSGPADSMEIAKGNYNLAANLATVINLIRLPGASTNHPLYSDMISPFFGVGSNGLARKVFFDPGMGQVQIIFDVKDITDLVSLPAPGFDGFSNNSPQFLVLEDELRAAGKGFEQWLTLTFHGALTTDVSEICYKMFRQYYGFNTKYNFIRGIGSILNKANARGNKVRNGQPAGLVNMNDLLGYERKLYNDLKAIHNFFSGIANEHYGKTFMVRIPQPRWYEDSSIISSSISAISAGIDNGVSNTIYIKEGSGKIYTDWEISPDGAWEEPGNWIDDKIIVGSLIGSQMTDDQGKIQPILGFDSSAEYDFKMDYLNRYHAGIRANFVRDSINMHGLTDYAMMLGDIMNRDSDADYYKSIKHQLPTEEYITLQYINPGTLNRRTAHGRPVPQDKIFKTYAKAKADPNIVFLEAVGGILAEPRVVMSLSAPVYIGADRNRTDLFQQEQMEQNALLKIARGVTIPTPVRNFIGGETIWGGLRDQYLDRSGARAIILSHMRESNKLFLAGGSLNPEDTSVGNISTLPKAAIPAFAAIPIQSNLNTYGPWINHPGSIENSIFDGRPNPSFDVNNLVGGAKIVFDENLTPWNYGGMDSLDSSVLDRIFEDVNYQQITEQGSITIPGYLLGSAGNAGSYNVGDALQANGPLISNIQVQIGEGGITTTYNMRTYVRKLGFFNKENAERIKLIGQESLKRRKEVGAQILSLQNKLSGQSVTNGFGNNSPAAIIHQMMNETAVPKLLSFSPVEVLAGYSTFNLHVNSSVTDAVAQLGYGPSWDKMPYVKQSITYSPDQMVKKINQTSLYDVNEVGKELKEGYANKSFMSLDGILSPISFYPTPFSSTFNVTKYPRPGCPFCRGTGRYTYKNFPDSLALNMNINNVQSTIQDFVNSLTNTSEDCTFCEPIIDKTNRQYISASPKEISPPYVLASGDDRTIISRNSLNALSGISGNPVINYATLNPVLLSVGEFSCFQNRQNNDLTGHSIGVVGGGLTAPVGEDYLQSHFSTNINRSFQDYDANYIEFCTRRGIPPDTSTTFVAPANNMRFFGLRGPLMVHGWGYDLEGYPVPNASGEPKVQNGNIVRDSNNNVIYKNQTQKPDGTWTKPYKENAFYKGWGQFPGTWPVGPVDLRWDGAAGVWTVGSNYKPVWVIIETDLIGNEPSRGEIVGDGSANEILPDGLRKLVFVKDNLGINPAPRGAQIYCKYDSKNGFYEPIYNRPYITSGVINGSTTVDIYKVYSTGTTNERYTTTYNNPLNFNVSQGDMGIFTFIGSGWVLQSYRC
jgi:hypothetical protein